MKDEYGTCKSLKFWCKVCKKCCGGIAHWSS